MSDTHIQNAIVQAIYIISNKLMSQASYDKTEKAIIKEIKDKATGEYLIEYLGNEFTAYATSSDLNYQVGEQVYIHIPKNDWNKNKIITSSVNNKATTFVDVPAASNLYNRLGTNLITLSQIGELCSYHSESKQLYPNGSITVDDNVISRYIKTGNALALGIKVKTNLDSSQVGGDYGLVLNLKFKNDSDSMGIKDQDAWENAAVRSYTVSSKDVIGNPYYVRTQTMVETLIEDIDIGKFLGVDSIEIFCDGFPQDSKQHPADIFISGVYVYGADALNEEQLNGYVVHIDYSETGNILDSDEEITQVTLNAQLKAKGQIVNQGAEYYWFRQNGLIFRGNSKYNGRAGDGWQCLNYYANTMAVPQQTGLFHFNNFGKEAPQEAAAACFQKVNRIRCVIVYQNRAFTGDVTIYNHDARSVSIVSSDLINEENKTVYYLNNGSPTLTAIVENSDGSEYQEKEGLSYTWRVTPQNGLSFAVEETEENYEKILEEYRDYLALYQSIAPADQQKYIESSKDYINTIYNNYKRYLTQGRVEGDQYINFPISSIRGNSKITCAVKDGDVYLGTGSIVLYNKIELQGSYSLSIDNGTQVFQYDSKGNSPVSEQLDKPLNLNPLTFTLLDNTGRQIPFEQIANNGKVRWLMPREGSLLSSSLKPSYNPIELTGEDKDFYNQGYDIYKDLPSFSYSIADQYDKDKINNDIRLNIRYKDLVFDAYTDFTFPKDGDPGTNGTDFVGKVYLESGAERLYCLRNNNKTLFFDSYGYQTNQLKFALYNDSIKLEDINEENVTWQIPPRSNEDKVISSQSHLTISNLEGQKGSLSYNSGTKSKKLPFVDIARAKYSSGSDINYYAEFPICYEQVQNFKYRIRVKPKTGFEYVVYSQDGTRPDYDNRIPFELIVEENAGSYWIADLNDLTYTWSSVGGIDIQPNGNKCTVKPVDKFDGSDLSTSLKCTVTGKIEGKVQKIGTINIPIYMILNRYGHQALNDWDGNSIELNEEGNYILAPQIGAGVKDSDNGFTGVFMGAIQGLEDGESDKDKARGIESDDYKIGFAGYHEGARTIFLDSKTGKAQFGKNNAGRIILDPSKKINEEDAALIYSGNYPIKDFLNPDSNADQQHKKAQYDVFKVGELPENRNKKNKGMIIDLSTPQIGFGSGNFTVNKEGHIVAKGGGQIAGWEITDTSLSKDDTGMASSNSTFERPDGKKDTKAFYSTDNFYATHKGYLFSKLGQIAGWNFDSQKLVKDEVGMNSDPTNSTYILKEWPDKKTHTAKAFFANGDNFYVTHDGYLRSTSGKIAYWDFDDTSLTNGNVGIGQKSIDKSCFSTNSNLTAKIWAGTNENEENFAVTKNGYLYSRAGKIGGWKIEQSSLSAKDSKGNSITIKSDGSIYSAGTKNNWGISADGSVSFTKGTIGNVKISDKGIENAKDSDNWHIWNDDVKFKNLRIDETGNIIYNVSDTGSGISNSDNTVGINSKGGYATPESFKIGNEKDSKTWAQHIVDLIVDNLFVDGNFQVLKGAEVKKNKDGTASISGGSKVIYWNNKVLECGENMTFLDGFHVTSGPIKLGGDTTPDGKTGTMIFSDGSTMHFQYGIFNNYKEGDMWNWDSV